MNYNGLSHVENAVKIEFLNHNWAAYNSSEHSSGQNTKTQENVETSFPETSQTKLTGKNHEQMNITTRKYG